MHYNINEEQNMLINIIEYGKKEVWKAIEEEKNPFERCRKRVLYKNAIEEIKKDTHE